MARQSAWKKQTCKHPAAAVKHMLRTGKTEPHYLLSPEMRLPNRTVMDNTAALLEVHRQKMTTAKPNWIARGYSPVAEGVVVLTEPQDGESHEQYLDRMSHLLLEEWKPCYEAMMGHKVYGIAIHCDEGEMSEDGKTLLTRNWHAHVLYDKTDERGKTLRVGDKEGMRKIQDMTARIFEGIDATERRERARKASEERGWARGLDHRKFRSAMRTAKAEISRQHARAETAERRAAAAEIERDEAEQFIGEVADRYGVRLTGDRDVDYRALRSALKASGVATQQDYMALRAAHEALRERAAKAEHARDDARRERDVARRERNQARREREQSRAEQMGAASGAGAETEITDKEIAPARAALEQYTRARKITIDSPAGLKRAYDGLRAEWIADGKAAAAAGRAKPHGQRDYSALRLAQQAMQAEIAQRHAARERTKRRCDRRAYEAREHQHDGFAASGGIGGALKTSYKSAELATARELGLRYAWDQAAQCKRYWDQAGSEVFTVQRKTVTLVRHDQTAEHAALRIAAVRFGGRVSIQGSSEFRGRMARAAVRERIEVADEDLRGIVDDERERQRQEDEQGDEQDLDDGR